MKLVGCPQTMHQCLLLLTLCVVHVSCQKIGSSLSQISFKTGSQFGGGDTVSLSVNWNGTNFNCTETPNKANQDFTCNLSSSFGTRNPSIEYYIYVGWDIAFSPLQIAEFTLTDNVGSTYTIRQFCHGFHIVYLQNGSRQ
eukprot:1009102_1